MSGELLATPSTPPMSKEDRERFALELREKLNSHRDVFTIDKFMFEPYDIVVGPEGQNLREGSGSRNISATSPTLAGPAQHLREQQKTISAATLRLLLDYCESNWEMDFVSYCAGIFHGREPNVGETAFDLLPDVQSRLSADRLGFGHIYGAK